MANGPARQARDRLAAAEASATQRLEAAREEVRQARRAALQAVMRDAQQMRLRELEREERRVQEERRAAQAALAMGGTAGGGGGLGGGGLAGALGGDARGGMGGGGMCACGVGGGSMGGGSMGGGSMGGGIGGVEELHGLLRRAGLDKLILVLEENDIDSLGTPWPPHRTPRCPPHRTSHRPPLCASISPSRDLSFPPLSQSLLADVSPLAAPSRSLPRRASPAHGRRLQGARRVDWTPSEALRSPRHPPRADGDETRADGGRRHRRLRRDQLRHLALAASHVAQHRYRLSRSARCVALHSRRRHVRCGQYGRT